VLSDGQTIILLGSIAAALQLVGYLAYVRNSEIEPNPLTWLMFAYGTILLTILEWDSDATRAELMLPCVCSGMALYVAGHCWVRARRADPTVWWPRAWWPDDWRDRSAFQVDLLLTALYLVAAMLLYSDRIGEGTKDVLVGLFLIAANLTTFSAFFPLIRNVVENPDLERTGPWATWACAYTLLGVTTFAVQGGAWNELMLYPLLNAVLHGTVAFLSRKSRRDMYLQALVLR